MKRNTNPNLPDPTENKEEMETPTGPVYIDSDDDSFLYAICTHCQTICGGHSIKHGGKLDANSRTYIACPRCGVAGEPHIEWKDSKTDKKV